eukprot:m.76229 g.76229  ORF g.76229 m.76229 type:complete len:66 (-) comp12482_c0_seq2:979-1176(-)
MQINFVLHDDHMKSQATKFIHAKPEPGVTTHKHNTYIPQHAAHSTPQASSFYIADTCHTFIEYAT